MVYVALLRGINVGGKNRVSMAQLKAAFEAEGFTNVDTYINSGNVVFVSNELGGLAQKIEAAILLDFGFAVYVVVRDLPNILATSKALPADWKNDTQQKTDVMFLWNEVDNAEIVNLVNYKPELETIKYVPGALLWNVERKNVTKSGILKLIGTPLYKQMTIRNVNTVRKLAKIMTEVNDSI